MRNFYRAAGATALLLTACPPSGSDSAPGCFDAALGVCTQRHDTGASETDLRAECDRSAGSWGPCPEAGRTGSCDLTFEADRASYTFVLYAGYICTPAEGEAYCDRPLDGISARSFTPGPATCGVPADHTVTCDVRSTGQPECADLSGAMPPERVALLEGICAPSGALAEAPCSTTDALARCEFWDPTRSLTVSETFYAGADLTSAEQTCSLTDGTWTVFDQPSPATRP